MKILLIGLKYHDYTSEIINELGAQGHTVTYHDIQPRDLLMKTLRVAAPQRYRHRMDQHHDRIVAAASAQRYDMVLFIQVHQMALATLAALRRQQAGAQFVLYNWDAISNHDYRAHLPHFDRAYTFDPQDAKAVGIAYLPLFCIPKFQHLRAREQGRRAVYFVGNIVSPQRYAAVQAFKRYCKQEGIEFNSFLACSTYVLYLLLRQGVWPRDVALRSIATPRFIDMIETSVAVFDFANHRQTGYTMRTIENLCAGKKIITSNAGIRNEPFFSDDRIHVFEGLDFSGVKAFLERPLRQPEAKFAEFHLASFVAHLVRGGA